MFKRFFIIFVCGLVFVSCDFFKKKEYSREYVIDTIIDYNSVDIFPLFPNCDDSSSVSNQKICSQIKLSEHIKAALMNSKFSTSKPINDTIIVTLNIDKTGKVSLSNLESTPNIQKQIPKLDSLILSGINSLPQLKPAIKRGMPVATEFSLPIVVEN